MRRVCLWARFKLPRTWSKKFLTLIVELRKCAKTNSDKWCPYSNSTRICELSCLMEVFQHTISWGWSAMTSCQPSSSDKRVRLRKDKSRPRELTSQEPKIWKWASKIVSSRAESASLRRRVTTSNRRVALMSLWLTLFPAWNASMNGRNDSKTIISYCSILNHWKVWLTNKKRKIKKKNKISICPTRLLYEMCTFP